MDTNARLSQSELASFMFWHGDKRLQFLMESNREHSDTIYFDGNNRIAQIKRNPNRHESYSQKSDLCLFTTINGERIGKGWVCPTGTKIKSINFQKNTVVVEICPDPDLNHIYKATQKQESFTSSVVWSEIESEKGTGFFLDYRVKSKK